MHCKYFQAVPYKALENFSKALYGETGGTYSARVFRPVMSGNVAVFQTLEWPSNGFKQRNAVYCKT